MISRFSLAVILLLLNSAAYAWEFRGEAGLEGRYFSDGPAHLDYWHGSSAYASAELFHEWNNRDDQFTFAPFSRLDERDDKRSHGDIRELSWIHVADGWESRVGISKVFWGVSEGRHLVDIVNQTDGVEQLDQEEKLGQPMINLSTVRDWGIVDVFLLPGFRERTFAGKDGRPAIVLPVDVGNPLYQSDSEDRRVDGAIRWQFFVGDSNIALSHFSGTTREPLLLPNPQTQSLTPLYHIIDQTGLELEHVSGGWIWKLEAISRSGQGDRYSAVDVGTEYTQVGLFGSDLDLGWIVEYLWEDREPLLASTFEHDWLLGNRLTFNDIASTEILWGLIWDPETEERAISLESSRRLGDRFKITLEGRFFSHTGNAPSAADIFQAAATRTPAEQPLSPFSNQDQVQVELVYFF